MKITIDTNSYNERRYSRPWIAKVILESGKLAFKFGDWIGQSGEKGVLYLELEPGEFFAEGQKDYRSNGGYTNYYRLKDDGSFENMEKPEVFKELAGLNK